MDTPRLVGWTQPLEDTTALDGIVRALEPVVEVAVSRGKRSDCSGSACWRSDPRPGAVTNAAASRNVGPHDPAFDAG